MDTDLSDYDEFLNISAVGGDPDGDPLSDYDDFKTEAVDDGLSDYDDFKDIDKERTFEGQYTDTALIDNLREYHDDYTSSERDMVDDHIESMRWDQSNLVAAGVNYGKAKYMLTDREKELRGAQIDNWDSVPGVFSEGGDDALSGSWSNVWRGVLSPETVVSLGAGKVAGVGAGLAIKAATRGALSGSAKMGGIAAGMAVDGVGNALTDAAMQGSRIETGVQDEFSGLQNAAAGVIGFGAGPVLGATAGGVAQGLGKSLNWAGRGIKTTASEAHIAARNAMSESTRVAYDKGLATGIGGASKVKETLDIWSDRTGLRLKQAALDKYKPLEGINRDVYREFRLAESAGDAIHQFLNVGAVKLLPDGDKVHIDFKWENGEVVKAGYKEAGAFMISKKSVMDKLGGDVDAFLHYQKSQREMGFLERNAREPEVILDKKTGKPERTKSGKIRTKKVKQIKVDMSDEAVEARRASIELGDSIPQWQESQKLFKAYTDAVLDFAVDGGKLSADEAATISKANKVFVPLYKEKKWANEKRKSMDTVLRKDGKMHQIKGSDNSDGLLDLFDNVTQNTVAMVHESIRNRAKRSLMEHMETLSPEDQAVAGWKEVKKRSENTINVMVDGKQKHFQTTDPLMLDSVNALSAGHLSQTNTIVKILGAPKRVVTKGATLALTFMGANTSRDAMHSLFMTEGKASNMIPFVAQAQGVMMNHRNNRETQEALLNGAGFASIRQADAATGPMLKAARRENRTEYKELNNAGKLLEFVDRAYSATADVASKPLKPLEFIGDKVENSSRLMEYTQLRKGLPSREVNGKLKNEGKTQAPMSRRDAAFHAREVSTDFTMGGTNVAVRALMELVPFLSAGVQGSYGTARKTDLKTKVGKKRLATLAVGMGVTSYSLEMLNSDIEMVQNAPEYVKMTKWIVPVDKAGIPSWFRNDETTDLMLMPKPYDVGVIPYMGELLARETLADENGIDKTGDTTGERVKNLGKMIKDVMLLDPTNIQFVNVYNALTDKAPKDFLDRDAIPLRMQGIADVQQFDNSTNAGAVLLGKGTEKLGLSLGLGSGYGISPKRVEHVIATALGTSAVEIAREADPLFRPFSGQSSMPERKLSEMPLLKGFFRAGEKSPKHTEQFYNLLEEAAKHKDTMAFMQKYNRAPDMAEMLNNDPTYAKIAAMNDPLRHATSALSDINVAISQIELSDETRKEKRSKIDKLRNQANSAMTTIVKQLRKDPTMRKKMR